MTQATIGYRTIAACGFAYGCQKGQQKPWTLHVLGWFLKPLLHTLQCHSCFYNSVELKSKERRYSISGLFFLTIAEIWEKATTADQFVLTIP